MSLRMVLGVALLAACDAAFPQAGEADAPAPLETIPVPDSAPPEPPAKPDDDAAQHFEEVVVTATKRAKSVRDVPSSINVLSGELLEKMGAHDLHDYLALTPGITLQEGQFGDVQSRNLSIRGVGSAPLTNQAVGQFIGDVPMTDPYSNFMTPDLDPFDLKAVEILKGPQGTYFGASALNGAIRYVPNAPDLGEWSGRGYVDYLGIHEGGAAASYGAAMNVPLGDSIAVRGMGVLQNVPGLVDNLQRGEPDADSRRKWSARAALRWAATDDLSIDLMYLKQASKTDDALPIDNPDERLTNDSHPGPSSIHSAFSLASADLRYDLGAPGTVVLQGSRQTKRALYDADGGVSDTGTQGIESLRGYFDADIKGTTGELRLVSPSGGNWSWILGAFALDYRAHVITDLYLANTGALGAIGTLPLLGGVLPGLPVVGGLLPALPAAGSLTSPRGATIGGQDIAPLRATEYAIYGELSRRFRERWELTAGTRFYKTHETGVIHSVGPTAPLIGDFPVEQGDRGISPKVSLTWRASPHLLAYATISRGFQFGGVNATTSLLPVNNPATGTPTPPTFKSSTLWNREVGIRTDWLHRTLRADLTYFNLDWNDAQFNQTQSNLVLVNTFVSNVGKVKSQGIEAALSWITPLRGLTLNGSAACTSALTQVPFTTGSGEVVPSGTQMPATPRWQTAATATYTLLLGSWVAAATLTDTWSSEAFNSIQHSHVIYDANLLSLDLSLARFGARFSPAIAVSVNNLTDERELIGYTDGTSLVSDARYFARPRSISLRFTAQFR